MNSYSRYNAGSHLVAFLGKYHSVIDSVYGIGYDYKIIMIMNY